MAKTSISVTIFLACLGLGYKAFRDGNTWFATAVFGIAFIAGPLYWLFVLIYAIWEDHGLGHQRLDYECDDFDKKMKPFIIVAYGTGIVFVLYAFARAYLQH